MEISNRQYKEVQELFDRKEQKIKDLNAEVRALKMELGDYDNVIAAEKGRRKKAEDELKTVNKKMKSLIAGNCATEATLKEAVKLMTELSDKVSAYEPRIARSDSVEFDTMLSKFSVIA